MDFKPVDYDQKNIPPDAPAGEWTATCSVKKSKTSKDNYPMLILEWKITEAADEVNESFVGASTSDFVTFFPEGHRASKMGKLKVKALCEHMEIDLDVIPTRIASYDDLADLIAGLDGQSATIWTIVRDRSDTGEKVTEIRYSKPGGGLLSAKPGVGGKKKALEEEEEEEDEEEEEEEEDDEDDEEAPPPRKTAAAAPPAKKKKK